MFTTIYRPKCLEEYIGNKDIIITFTTWLFDWDVRNDIKKCLLISGYNGIGKSLLVDLILNKYNYNGIIIGLDDNRDKNYILNVIKPLIQIKNTLNNKKNILIVSEVDCGNDNGFISSLIECIKDTKIPIIFICDNRYDQLIKPLLNHCIDIKMKQPKYEDVYNLLYNVVINEKIKIKRSELKNLYIQSNGDIRFILNTMQMGLRIGEKIIQSENIFETTSKLLSMDESIDNKYETYWLANDLHTMMIQENYVNNLLYTNDVVKNINNLSYSANALSDADLFDTQIYTLNREFEHYVAFSTINATTKCNKKTTIKFPIYLSKKTSQINKSSNICYNNINIFNKFLQLKNQKNDNKTVQQKRRGRPQKTK